MIFMMKLRQSLIIIFLILNNDLSGQIFTFLAENLDESFDQSLMIGFDENASVDLDTLDFFFERDFEDPLLPNDIRIYQRKDEDFNCLKFEGEEIYFPVSFDSRTNIRGKSCPSDECLFELVVESGYFNDFSINGREPIHRIGNYIKRIKLYNQCDSLFYTFENEPFPSDYDVISFPGVVKKDTVRLIILEFGSNDLVSSQSVIQTENQFEVYPNPVSTILNIKSKISEGKLIYFEIYNLIGQLQLQQTENWKDQIQLDIASLPTGLHQLIIKSDEGETLHLEKILKL